jgi:uncharacterized membrane protein (UPF0127 family)
VKKATRRKLIEWALTALLSVLLVLVVWYRFFGPGHVARQPTGPPEQQWSKLPVVATVEVANNDDLISRGLMGRDSLPPNSGMYFLYDDSSVRTFWMSNTRIPLSIAFIRSDGVITSIRDMQPFDETPISSEQIVKDALEMNQGWFDENGIHPGDRAQLVEGEVHFWRPSR